MAKEEPLEFTGTVSEILPNAMFRVNLIMITKFSPIRRERCASIVFGCLQVIVLTLR